MTKFLFLLRDNQHSMPGPDRSPLYSGMSGFSHWLSELALSGNYLWGEMLGKSVCVVSNGDISPKMPRWDAVIGCFLILAENADQAGAIAQDCPAVLTGNLEIEVRPVIEDLS